MRNYVVLRHAKLKTRANIASSLAHCFRERNTPNADPERTPLNRHEMAGSMREAMANFERIIPDKIRKNAVLAIEYVMSASPEWFESTDPDKHEQFYKGSKEWLTQKYGADNIFNFSIHLDEKTPHVSAYVVPMTADGRLCAREFVGGRQALREAQDSFGAKMSPLGLKRGVRGSKATHTTIKQHYERLSREFTRENEKAIIARFREWDIHNQNAQAQYDNALILHNELSAIEESLTNGLTDNQLGRLIEEAEQMREYNEMMQREAQQEVTPARPGIGRDLDKNQDYDMEPFR